MTLEFNYTNWQTEGNKKIKHFCKEESKMFFIKVAYWISPILRLQYWTFLFCSLFSYRSSNFAIAKLSLLIPLLHFLYKYWFMASFLYWFPYSYRSSNYCDSNSCRYFTFLKAIAKNKSTHIAIAFKSEKVQ